jgi:putative acetyltransferase
VNYKIETPAREDYPQIVNVWEASVRATHHFLREEDIKPLILDQYLDMVELRVLRTEKGKIIAFLGVHQSSLEMLFLHPDNIGKGLGRGQRR